MNVPPGTWRTCSCDELVVVRRVPIEKLRRVPSLQDELDVLAGEELQPLVRGQLQRKGSHVVGDALHLLHAAGSFLTGMSPARRTSRASITTSVVRLRLAEERIALCAARRR